MTHNGNLVADVIIIRDKIFRNRFNGIDSICGQNSRFFIVVHYCGPFTFSLHIDSFSRRVTSSPI